MTTFTSKSWVPYLFILPAFAVLAFVIFYPMGYNLVNSTFSVRAFDVGPQFIGLEHYRDLLSDDRFFNALKLTFVWTAGCTLFQYLLGLAIALLLNERLWISRFVRPLYVLPWILPGVVAAMAFRFMYASDIGLINVTLRNLGLEGLAHAWISRPETAMAAAILLGVWKGFPFYMVMLLAGLQTIPVELVEAARLEGASRWQVIRHITLPLLRPISSTAIILGVIWTSNYFDGIFLLTGGGPARATETLAIYIYNVGFASFNLPLASAASVLLLVLVTLFSTLYLFLSNRSSHA